MQDARTSATATARDHRPLLDRLDLASGSLPAGGNWYPEDNVLEALTDLIEACLPKRVLALNGGLAIAVLARAMRGHGEIWLLEHDPQVIDVTQHLISQIGEHAPVHVVEAELQDYDKHHLWYDRWVLHRIPNDLDLIFIDGPPHFCGRTPRWPAGRELFHKLAPTGRVVLDKAKRVKEKKALARWAEEFPNMTQSKLKRGGGAVVLTAG